MSVMIPCNYVPDRQYNWTYSNKEGKYFSGMRKR